ncbi:hypothetical protein IWW54_007163, partial [Coemansia sp. RSA 2705]
AVNFSYIVRLYDIIETERYIGIVIEYASGGELFDHILAHRQLKENDACRLFAQLIAGVSYLHASNIVHRDLKLVRIWVQPVFVSGLHLLRQMQKQATLGWAGPGGNGGDCSC